MELQAQHQAFQDAGIGLVGVVVASEQAVDAWCQRSAISYPILPDPTHTVGEAYGIYNLLGDNQVAPSVFVIDTDGHIVWYETSNNTGGYVPAEEILSHVP